MFKSEINRHEDLYRVCSKEGYSRHKGTSESCDKYILDEQAKEQLLYQLLQDNKFNYATHVYSYEEALIQPMVAQVLHQGNLELGKYLRGVADAIDQYTERIKGS